MAVILFGFLVTAGYSMDKPISDTYMKTMTREGQKKYIDDFLKIANLDTGTVISQFAHFNSL